MVCIKLLLFIKVWYYLVVKLFYLILNLFLLNEFVIRMMIGKYKNKYIKFIKLNLIECFISLVLFFYLKVYLYDSRCIV